ncbi:rhodanese-like domain-containing protein [Haloferula rosea]|uniref:Rhodanese-like domain-containing protein n=1 Tax=Haloferula rosea TaxID=490093 RepID=A0A934RCF2_9BACT|nr:rhodanese-like domain-containing protein [Haloferula rosea]MBK1825900.1 rhodanese-like domain-containing protein [Haloferula rosea]
MSTDSLSVHSPMKDIMEAFPGARRALFSRYHLGGCQSCGFAPEETLEQLAKRAGDHDPEEMLKHLRDSHRHDQEMLIPPSLLRSQLDSDSPPLLVDTRTREEHDAVSIAGSVFMTQELQQELFAGDPERAIVLYDHQGKHGLDHGSWFQGHGLKNTRVLEGGIDAWSQEVDPSLRRYRLEID